MSKPQSFFERWWVPMALTTGCLLFAVGAGLALGPPIFLLTIMAMPLPLVLFWLSWNVPTPEERIEAGRRARGAVAAKTERTERTEKTVEPEKEVSPPRMPVPRLA